ncbi:MAG: FAD-binding protein [Calditrichaceae bacterium]|nr:FAD-binding protein [Calditrichaceae bacterium]
MRNAEFGTELQFLKESSAEKRVKAQKNALDLLFEKYRDGKNPGNALSGDALYQKLRPLLSEGTMIFSLSEVQRDIYHSDSGTAVVPEGLKKRLLNVKCRFVVRPGTLQDLQEFVKFAWQEKIHYTVRGAGSWPFGGVIPLNNEIVLDLSYLDFHDLDKEKQQLTAGPGVLFADMRQYLKKNGFALRQEITNPNSGTICGWVVTGGLGIGAYKYGPVKNSVEAIFLLRPDGEWVTLTPTDEAFQQVFDSEGQIGIVAGVVLKVKRESYVSKPYAFSFSSAEDTRAFVRMLREWEVTPTSIIYFDKNYLRTTYEIQKDKNEAEQREALEAGDDLRIARVRRDMEIAGAMRDLEHVIVMEFDARGDYQKCLKYSPFNAKDEGTSRYRELTFRRLPVSLAHKLWKHRYAPVEMKSRGPSMLVSETILPLDKFPEYMTFVQSAITNWTDNPVKTEGHFLSSGEILIQSILLADTSTTRHKVYLGLVPFMIQTSLFFGGRPYGTGIWNLPFFRQLSLNGQANRIAALTELKKKMDPEGLLNQGKFINPVGRKLALRLFQKSAIPLKMGVGLLHKGWEKRGNGNGHPAARFSPGLLLWRANKTIFPAVVPPKIEVKRHPLLAINSACAECDSCERVCPTSDVFGLLGAATPITRRKTANRLARGEKISQEEALGFLVCTRCDNCTRVCPTDIPLTDMFDLVESNPAFQAALGLNKEEKKEFIDRMWQVMKESPLYKEHTLAEQKEDRSHLEHGLNIKYQRGYAYSKLFIDPETCIHCGMCAHENACIYGARRGNPREIPELIDENCALCNACINFCPQNKAVQTERDFVQNLISNAVDLDEKRFWESEKLFLRDTTTIQRSPQLTEMADKYVTEEILMEIDKEASTGQIPVSGMGQGDRHMGIGFDAERFSHFHIVGPAQNRLHEGDPDEELSVQLGKRHRYCKFDSEENLHNPPFPKIKLMSPILYNAVPLDSNGRLELAFIKVAEKQHTLAVIDLNRILEHYDFFLQEGNYAQLPAVVVPRVDLEIIDRLRVNPNVKRELLIDLWRMPMFEIEPHREMARTVQFIQESAKALHALSPLLCGYLEVSEYDIVAGELLPELRKKVEEFMSLELDVIHIHGERNKDEYFVTSQAVRAIHHYLLSSGRRHQVALIASGGIRLASDSQKTIQRGAEATLIDFAAMLALDPYAYKAMRENKATTDILVNLDVEWAVKRLNHQMDSRKVQILEVLGAAGFKDIKKTVGEEGRLIDFYELEERIQKHIFEKEEKVGVTEALNKTLLAEEPLPAGASPGYSELKKRVKRLKSPHHFYELGGTNQTVYQRDHVWPGNLIQTLGRMAAGDEQMFYLKNVKSIGLLGDGFDVMKILYQRDPDIIPDVELDKISTALPLDKGLVLQAPWMFGGKSVGSIGLDTWRAHVIAARELGIQYDTGEGGYPTCFFLNRKGEPIFFSEPDIQLIKGFFKHDTHYTAQQIKSILIENGIAAEKHPGIFKILNAYPELQPFLFYEVVSAEDEPFVSTELKTGLFGVTKETIKKARRVVIAYSQGAKMGIGGHILAGKVNRLVSYLRGIQGLEKLETAKLRSLIERIERIEKNAEHPLKEAAGSAYPHLLKSHDDQAIYPELKEQLWLIQQKAYDLNAARQIDPIEFEQVLRLCEEIISYSYTSVISPFPFHNCYSIEDVKAFIDMVRMVNPEAVVSVKVSPSVDIEFIAAGLGRIARDNTEAVVKMQGAGSRGREQVSPGLDETVQNAEELAEYARKYGMKIEVWLDGPRGGTGASPNIIKGQMGMHIEYAIPLIHDRLVRDGLRNYVKFIVSGGIRTYEDVIKAVALGADGVIWGTAPLVAVGCDRNRNCHDGCSRGIATSNLIMQNLRDVELNSRQMVNAFIIMQMQVIRALAGLGLKDIRALRGRFDKIQWIGLKERVDFRIRQRREHSRHPGIDGGVIEPEPAHALGQTNCGVAAVIGSDPVPSYILDEALHAMKNRGMDGVGVGKTLCFPDHPHHYAFRVMVKGRLQLEVEEELRQQNGSPVGEGELQREARQKLLEYRYRLAEKIKKVFLDDYFDFYGETGLPAIRESYKKDAQDRERDYREFGNPNTDPGDVFRFFVRVKEAVRDRFIEQELLIAPRFLYIREYFPAVSRANYRENPEFLRKAEDLFVFNHSVLLTQVLYTYEAQPEDWETFMLANKSVNGFFSALAGEDPLSGRHLDDYGKKYLELLRDFARAYHYTDFEAKYRQRVRKIAAVMSCGKNFAVWKTAGREIPWETPAAPNNIIHVRLATGSIVEQMNAHPFGKLHTALTHNGETTNYETLKQRVEQFGLPPLATTDTEVASLKFHLVAEELEYPDWALFEAFSPTTGDDLALIPPELRGQLEEVQRVEFTSSPDGPYQYLCLRHQPERNITERVDLKDPADLRPSTTAFWYDAKGERKRAFSIIASEEQAIQKVLDLLDREGLIAGAAPDRVLVSNGMISRFEYDEQGEIHDFHIIDRYGREIHLDDPGEHYSIRRSELRAPANAAELEAQIAANAPRLKEWIRENLPGWDFDTYRWVVQKIANGGVNNFNWQLPIVNCQLSIELLTHFIDYLRTMDTGTKAAGSLIDVTRAILYDYFDRLAEADSQNWVKADMRRSAISAPLDAASQTLLIDARGFEPEGIDPKLALSAFLAHAYDLGWRKYVLYRVSGQRLISTAVMGHGDTDDVEMEVYGTPGEYFGAFMQGGTIRCHGNAQNFCAMGMHHGNLYVFGNAGKVCGYASKGGAVYILGDVVDRGWTNSVNDPRCQDLQIHILGSASKYCGESLMGGDFFFGGLYFDSKGKLRMQERPYRGTKLLGGASRGNMLFFDPENRLDPHQYTHGKFVELTADNWPYWKERVESTLRLAGVEIWGQNGSAAFIADGKEFKIAPENFRLIIPRGGLKGYESH